VKVGSRNPSEEEVDGDKYLGGGRHGLVHVGEGEAAAVLNGDREMEL
jgi:hypothetical protein